VRWICCSQGSVSNTKQLNSLAVRSKLDDATRIPNQQILDEVSVGVESRLIAGRCGGLRCVLVGARGSMCRITRNATWVSILEREMVCWDGLGHRQGK